MTTAAAETVRAIVRKGYGDPERVLALDEVEKPELEDDTVLVRVRAAGIARADYYGVTAPALVMRPLMLLMGPKTDRVGTALAGVVEAVGRARTDVQPGDEVFGARTGALAEYVLAKEPIVRKPANVGFEEAGAVAISGLTALQAIRDKGNLQPGQSVLVNGASGGVGTFAVQLAKALGAGEVDAVCSTRNVEQAAALGADRVFDYTKEDYTRSGRSYDLIVDVAGTKPWSANRRLLRPGGTLVLVGAPKGGPLLGPIGHILPTYLASLPSRRKLVFFVAKIIRPDLAVLAGLLESGKVRSLVDRAFPLAESAEAMRYLGEGHARANVVVTI